MTEQEVEQVVAAQQKAAKNRGLGWLLVSLVLGLLTFGIGWSVNQANEAEDKAEVLAVKAEDEKLRLDALERALAAQVEQFELCRKKIATEPECQAPIVPDPPLDEGEIQEFEIQEREIQEREIQERENQNGEKQESEAQESEEQEGEVQEGESQEPEIQDNEIQDDEVQDPEIQDNEVPESWTFQWANATWTCTDPDGDKAYTCVSDAP